mgnify:FL=1|jgi:hypothetical protein|tara:strand:+ start:397 stop:501 length:105 start_codon:yes stop_codon:yes gene_type:complete
MKNEIKEFWRLAKENPKFSIGAVVLLIIVLSWVF